MYVVWVDVKAYEGDDFLPIESEWLLMGRKNLARKKEFLPILPKREAVGRAGEFSFLPMIKKYASMGRTSMEVGRKAFYGLRDGAYYGSFSAFLQSLYSVKKIIYDCSWNWFSQL